MTFAIGTALRSAPPHLVMCRLAAVKALVEILLVEFQLEMRELQPHPREVERIRMRWEAAVGVVDVVADLLGVLYRFGPRPLPRHLEKCLAVLGLPVRPVEDIAVPIGPSRPVLLLNQLIHSCVH